MFIIIPDVKLGIKKINVNLINLLLATYYFFYLGASGSRTAVLIFNINLILSKDLKVLLVELNEMYHIA